jgi:hypothetical protein
MTATQSPNTHIAPNKLDWRGPASALQLGVAQRNITPPIGIMSGIWGAAKKFRSESVHYGLFVTVVANQDPAGQITYIAGIDLAVLGCVECADIMLGAITEELGIDRDHLLFASSHTHASPIPCIHRSAKEGSEFIPGFIEQIIEGTVSACKEAAGSIANVDVSWAYGKCDLAVNRDLPCGAVEVVAFNPDIVADDTLAVGRISNSGGKVIGTIANYACHPTTLAWKNTAISPDYVGKARAMVEKATSAPMLFLQGASGDLSPRNQYSGDTIVADKNGSNLGYSILATLASMQSPGQGLKWEGIVESGALLGEWLETPVHGSDQVIKIRLNVPVQVKDLKSIETLRAEWAGIDPGALEERIARAERLRIGYVSGAMVDHPLWIWQWGEAYFVAQPGEAYSFIQTELRRRHPDKIIFVMNLTNSPGLFYLPTKSAYVAPAYQAWQTLLAPGSLDAVIDAADSYLKSV